MFYLLSFDCDDSLDVVEDHRIICEEDAKIGDFVQVMYVDNKKRSCLYTGKILEMSADKDALEKEYDRVIEEYNNKAEDLGRGKRLKRMRPSSDDLEEPNGDQKKKKKALQKNLKAEQAKETAKQLAKMIQTQTEIKETKNSETDELLKLQVKNLTSEVERQNSEIKRLRKERAEAIEASALLKTAKSLVEGLTALKNKSSSLYINPLPGPSATATSRGLSAEDLEPCTSTQTAPTSMVVPDTHTPSSAPGDMMETAADVNSIEEEQAVEVPEHFKKQLLYNGTEADVCKLMPHRNIYVSKAAKAGLTQYSKNSSTLVRSGVIAIFSQHALTTCSVRGTMAKGPKGKPEEKRDGLYPEALSALLEFAKQMSIQKGWEDSKLEKSLFEKPLIAALGTKLSEVRRKALPVNDTSESSSQ